MNSNSQETPSDAKILFEVGKCYHVANLYGGLTLLKCIARTEKTVTFDEPAYKDAVNTYNIEVIDNSECVLYWEYRGHNCYISAELSRS